MKTLFLVLLTFLSLSCYRIVTQDPQRETLDSFIKRTVRVDISCLGFPSGYGSGVIVRSGENSIVATARHVVDNPLCFYSVVDYKGSKHDANILQISGDADAAILVVGEDLGVDTYLDLFPYLGESITCLGWPNLISDPYNYHMSVTRGHVSTMWIRDSLMRISADTYFGGSGGPCLSDRGSLVGLVTEMWGMPYEGGFMPQPGQFYITGAKSVKTLLDKK